MSNVFIRSIVNQMSITIAFFRRVQTVINSQQHRKRHKNVITGLKKWMIPTLSSISVSMSLLAVALQARAYPSESRKKSVRKSRSRTVTKVSRPPPGKGTFRSAMSKAHYDNCNIMMCSLLSVKKCRMSKLWNFFDKDSFTTQN